MSKTDADYVRSVSGFAMAGFSPDTWVSKAIGGVSPLGWISKPEIILIDEALSDYDVVWAAAGHPHAVYPTTYDELIQCTGAQPMIVGD
jgi:prolyl-tRNA editing enzyme YbaK/EbsC (Cys-tRNA(Pro) deacylase)